MHLLGFRKLLGTSQVSETKAVGLPTCRLWADGQMSHVAYLHAFLAFPVENFPPGLFPRPNIIFPTRTVGI